MRSSKTRDQPQEGVDILTTPVFDWLLFSPDFVIHFESVGAGRSLNLLTLSCAGFFGHSQPVWGGGGCLVPLPFILLSDLQSA